MSNVIRGGFRTRAARPRQPTKLHSMIDDLIQALDANAGRAGGQRSHNQNGHCLGLPKSTIAAVRERAASDKAAQALALPERRTDSSPCLGLPRGVLSQPFTKKD